MTDVSYDELSEENRQRVDASVHVTIPDKDKALYRVDEAGQIIGFRNPAMFQKDVPIKWSPLVFSLETGEVAGKPKKGKNRTNETNETDGTNGAAASPEAALDLAPPPAAMVPGEQLAWFRHADILPSPLQPRTHFNAEKMAELKASLRQYGFSPAMSRLWLRPHPSISGKVELIAGERRWRMVGELIAEGVLEDRLPGVIDDLTDAQVLEFALVENLDRDDLSPLDEAVGVCRLLECKDEAGEPVHTAKSLAERLGRPEQHISRCRALRRLLGTPAGAAVEAGALSLKHGELLAGIASPEKRDELTGRLVNPSDGRTPGVRELELWISTEVQKELRGCGFSQEDETLVGIVTNQHGERIAGGACTDCPLKVKGAKFWMCTNPDCFAAKGEATHRRWMESVQQPGVTALDPREAERIFAEDGVTLAPQCGMVDLEEKPEEWELRKGMEKASASWKKLTHGREVPESWIKDAKGTVRKLIPREMAIAAALENKHDIFRRAQTEVDVPEAPDNAVDRAAASAERERNDAAERARNEAAEEEKRHMWMAKVGALAAVMEVEALPDGFWPTMWWMLNGYFQDGISISSVRHEMEPEVWDGHGRTMRGSAGASALIEAIVHQTWWDGGGEEADLALIEWAKVYGVDLKKAEKEAKKAFAQTQKAAAAAVAPPPEEGSKSKKKSKSKKAEAAEPEPVRAHILRLAEPRGMSMDCLDQLARRVIGKPTFEEARGNELTAMLEAVDELTEYDPDEGWIEREETFMCPRCGALMPYGMAKETPRPMTLACSPACGYSGAVPPAEEDEPLPPPADGKSKKKRNGKKGVQI